MRVAFDRSSRLVHGVLGSLLWTPVGCSGPTTNTTSDAAAPTMDGAPSGSGMPPSTDATTSSPTDSSATAPRTYAPTYTAVWAEILLPTCALLYCHGGAGLQLELVTKAGGYTSLMGLAEGEKCKGTGLYRIEPGAPDRSLVVLKVGAAPPCGDRMPIALAGPPLDTADIEQLRQWVLLGAPDD